LKQPARSSALAITLVALFVAALIPRLWLAVEFPSSIGDGETYNLVADNIRLNGCVSLSPIEGATCAPHAGGNQPPGYPIVIAATHYLFGRSDRSVGIAQAALTAVTIVYATWRLATLTSTPAAILTGIMLALSFVSIAWARLVFTESLTIILSIIVLVESLRLRARPGVLAALWLGICLAAATFLRYDGLLLAAPVGVLLLWARPLSVSLPQVVVIGMITIMPLAIWGARNVANGLAAVSVEYVPKNEWPAPNGYIAWVSTWVVNQFDYPNVMFPVASGSYLAITIPDAAYAGFNDRMAVEQALVELQFHDGRPFPATLDARFAALAEARLNQVSLARHMNLYVQRAIHMWATPFFSSGWPVRVNANARKNSREGGLFATAKALPVAALAKGTGTAYRIVLLLGALGLAVVAIRRGHQIPATLLIAALAFATLRPGSFVALGLTETRYLAPIFPWLEVGIALALGNIFVARASDSKRKKNRADVHNSRPS
jgi:hypothetical protein